MTCNARAQSLHLGVVLTVHGELLTIGATATHVGMLTVGALHNHHDKTLLLNVRHIVPVKCFTFYVYVNLKVGSDRFRLISDFFSFV